MLDSLVKNVGSPYTVYFGRNLHETFMLAYSQVDQMVRRKLEEMLKTWREPVPGSLSNVPVFPLPSTQSIIDALNRYKQTTAPRPQQNPQQAQIRPPSVVPASVPYRATPAPQNGLPYSPPPINVQQPTPTPQPQQPPYYQVSFNCFHMRLILTNTIKAPVSQPPTPIYQAPLQPYQNTTPQLPPAQVQMMQFPQLNAQQNHRGDVDVAKLHADIDDLTLDAKIFCTTHPMDQAATKKLQTLQTLKEILDSGAASDQDLRDIRGSIDQQLVKKAAEKQVAQFHLQTAQPQMPYQQAPQWQLPNAYPQPEYPPQQYPQLQYQTPAPAPAPAPTSLINSANLADLLRKAQSSVQPPQPQPQPYGQSYPNPAVSTPALPAAVPILSNGTLSLLDQIRTSGILSKAATPNQGTTPPTAFAQLSLDDVPFTSTALKIPRPHLILRFMNEKPNQCSTCGRRFTSDDAGKAKKEKHLDWHFKTKARGIEAEQRGQNRSWYVDELDWISTVEQLDDLGLEDGTAGANGNLPAAAKKKQEDIVRAPSDPVVRNLPCPIDQEPFKSEWSADIQDFIWRDAIKVGDRYYHASCYREMMKGRETTIKPTGRSTPLGVGHKRTNTPDSVLGKRKAEDDEPGSANKLRMKIEA